jgi:hypothetical protein
MPMLGDHVAYRALAGGVYPAEVVAIHPDGKLDLAIELPGVKGPFGRTKVPWSDAMVATRGVAFPQEPTQP